jgi:hypothetical protein
VEVDGGAGRGVDPLAATPTDLERLGEDLAGLVKVAEQAAFQDRAQDGQDLGVAEDVGGHGVGLAVPAVQLAQAEAQPGRGVLDGLPGGQVGGRVQRPLLATPERDQAAIDQVVAPYQLDIDFTTIPTLAEQHHLRLG